MSDTVAPSALQVQKWDADYFKEYLHFLQGFKPVMGTGTNAVIQVKEDLTKGKGDNLTIALVNQLTNDPTTGTTVLEGNEEDMASRSHTITINKRRNAVRVAEMDEKRSAIDLRNAARDELMTWSQKDTRDYIIDQMGTLNGTLFTSRTAAIADAWLVDNADRVLFGASSPSLTDMSADLANLDTTADLFTFNRLDEMVLKAKTCSPKIRPMRDPGNGRRYYIAYANPYAFKDLRDSIDDNILANTSVQAEASKLFEGGDIMWNGVIVKEVDDLPIYANLGASSTTEVTPVYLCGAQAIGFCWGRRWKTVTKTFDYEDKTGVAVDGIYGISKLTFGTGVSDTDDQKDHGIVTGFFATTGAATVASAGEIA